MGVVTVLTTVVAVALATVVAGLATVVVGLAPPIAGIGVVTVLGIVVAGSVVKRNAEFF